CPCRHPRGGLTRRGTAAAAAVAHPVFFTTGIEGLALPAVIGDFTLTPGPGGGHAGQTMGSAPGRRAGQTSPGDPRAVLLWPPLLDRRAGRQSVEYTGEDPDQIFFSPLCRIARLAGFTSG